jgi:hypothetical protein
MASFIKFKGFSTAIPLDKLRQSHIYCARVFVSSWNGAELQEKG